MNDCGARSYLDKPECAPSGLFFKRAPPVNHYSLPDFEPDSLMAESAGSAPGCRPASPGTSEVTTHARTPACGTHPLQ